MKTRIHITIRGAVQGVGFRPFIYKLAHEVGLPGFVLNSPTGVLIEAEGEKEILDRFVLQIQFKKPPHAIIYSMEFSFLDPAGYIDFQIRESDSNGKKSAFIMPDLAVCDECLTEMFDLKNRRYLYPFINCTHCGPRFSIIESLPYDRPNTSMKQFKMCESCKNEYDNPLDRRFHAQPIACPDCGPHIEVWDKDRNMLAGLDTAIQFIVDAIKNGRIVAMKGLGGYQLICRADDDKVIGRLRERKKREEKPFAVMFPTMKSIQQHCEISNFEERLLHSAESPIVLVRRKENVRRSKVSLSVAPENPYLGAMLPYTPLHHILLRQLKLPVVATSGNVSEEPMATAEDEAVNRLHEIADFFLVHDRPIVRHVDDSIVRVVMGREMIMRRARGYAPLPITINHMESIEGPSVMAVGGHLKNTIAISIDKNIFTSQHIGDLSTQEAYTTFFKVGQDFRQLYNVKPKTIACDKHPEYLSSKFAETLAEYPIQVQHHEAHIAACRLENQIEGQALGVSWDGTGYGHDGTIWGGEFFISNDDGFKHVAQLRQFRLPGGEKAVKEPRRCAVGILYEMFGEQLFTDHQGLLSNFKSEEAIVIHQMLSKKINSPITSSAGRLFDAVASLIGLRQHTNYEGQSAMMLEFAADSAITGIFDFELRRTERVILDWQPMIEAILIELRRKVPASILAAKFHNTLAEMIVAVAKETGDQKVILSGGCFQNAVLLEKTVQRLKADGFKVYWHQRIPTNDGGIAVGQVAIAIQSVHRKSKTEMEHSLV
ncbi:carbamoyltransferase HypF [bacterium]|nr:MAG: carbamoyltransferase HypF [bacterium]